MIYLIYFFIFIFKIIEDALATLRLIVVSNGKKVLGAILQFIVTLIWIVLTGTVLMGLQKDLFKVLAFALGALFGSYFGSFLEEKIALGMNLVLVELENKNAIKLKNILEHKKFSLFKIFNDKSTVLFIICKRRQMRMIITAIRGIDKNAIIISEKIKVSL